MQLLLWRPLFAYSQRILGTEISNDYNYIYPPWLTTPPDSLFAGSRTSRQSSNLEHSDFTIKLRHTVIVNQAALGFVTWCLSAFFLFLLGKSRQSFLSTFQVALRFASAMAQD